MDGRIGVQFSGFFYGRVLRRLDSEGLFDAAAEDGVTVSVFSIKRLLSCSLITGSGLYLFRGRTRLRPPRLDADAVARSWLYFRPFHSTGKTLPFCRPIALRARLPDHVGP
jgi:hypothetical protein